jgi:peptidoglycan/xylan/chitin deacetylase (PgdA/CDA1 family)
LSAPQISLLYHDVLPEGLAPGQSGFEGADADVYKLPEALFAEHLERIAGLGDGRARVLERAEPPKAPQAGGAAVLFTFDDGGVTALEPTARLLERQGWRGHFFVVTERLGRPGFLSHGQVRELRARGHVVGSHSHTHPAAFSTLPYGRMLDEWRRSRQALEEILGEPVWCASVPGGYYSRAVARAAREAGYQLLFNSEPEQYPRVTEGLWVLGRYGIQRGTSARMALALARANRWPRTVQSLTWNAKKPLKKLGGPAWLAFRRWFFNAR